MTALRLSILMLLLTAPAAQAAPLVEQPFEPLPNRAVATCLRATGTPGGLAIFGPIAARSRATDLLAAGGGGTARIARVDFGSLVDCAAVATAPGGAAVVAGAVRSRARVVVRAVVQEPGGAFTAPVTLGDSTSDGPAVAAAVSPSGHAVVAWLQTRGAPPGGDAPFRIVAARRMPGGGFGPFQRLTPWRRGRAFAGVPIAAGIDNSGVATVAWARPSTRGTASPDELTVETASAAPGAAFAMQRLADRALGATEVALAVAPDGWAVIAHAGSGGTRAFERAPGATRFSTAFRAELAEDSAPTVAIRDGGGAVVAWRQGPELDVAGVEATARPAAGAFPEALTVAAPGNDDDSRFGVSTAELSVVGPFPTDEGNWTLRSALAPDGRALLAWGGSRTAAAGGALIPHVAAGTLGGGFGRPQALGSPVRDVNGVAPVFLPDGRVGLAWTDNVAFEAFGLLLPSGTGRLHLAVESAAAAPEPALPGLRVRARRTQRLFDAQRLKVRATCDRACDLRAVLHGGSFDRQSITRTLLGAGTARFAFPSADPALRARSRVVVQATGPGGHELTGARVRVKVVRRKPLPVPPPLGVTARRRGSAIVISWHTALPARRAIYIVAARRSRDRAGGFDRTRFGFTHGRARTRFTVRLHPRRPGRLHWVTVQGDSIDEGRPTREVGASVAPV